MYDRAWHKELSQKLAREDEANELKDQHALLVQMELVFYILECLHLEQAVRGPWLLLGGLPIPLFAQLFTEEEQQMIARARVYSPYSGRFRWETDLRAYMKIPEKWRAYSVHQGKLLRTGKQASRFAVFDHYIRTPIPERRHHQKKALAGERVHLVTYRPQKHNIELTIDRDVAQVGNITVPWFSSPRERERGLLVDHDTLLATAHTMTLCEQAYLAARGEKQVATDWVALAHNIRFRKCDADGNLREVNEVPLLLQGNVHLPGTISAGKTTLMKLLAFQATQERWRITLIVGNVMTALELADFYNNLLCGEADAPVAVPILGKTTLKKNLTRLCNAASYKERGYHRAFRYLDIACLLLNEVPSAVPEVLALGEEPCQKLVLVSRAEHEQQGDLQRSDTQHQKTVLRACPLFSICPMQRAYHDLFHAPIWITTPGALGSMTIPTQVEKRQLKLWELIYEQSRLVCFDEADMIQNWFDRVCAPEVPLIGKHGIFDRIDPQLAEAWTRHRILEPESHRWVLATRHAVVAASDIVSQLEHHFCLKQWVQHTYFTAYSLFFHLACLVSGAQEPRESFEFDLPDDEEQEHILFPKKREISLQNKKFNTIMNWFYQVMESDPQRTPLPLLKGKDPVSQLLSLREHILTRGSCPEETQAWLTRFIPNIQAILSQRTRAQSHKHHSRVKTTNEWAETVKTVALKLDFALMVSVLDAEMQIIYDEWYSGLVNITEEYRFEHAPRHLVGLLPIPPTGSLFGFYCHSMQTHKEQDPREESPQKDPCLEIFAYSLIGRAFLTQFHRLRAAIDARPGPHVLALSGSSWLPHSSLWHLDIPPVGVLEPDEPARNAIASSTFTFLPQYEKDHGQEKPIFVSGTKMMLTNLRKIAFSLSRGENAPLRQELQTLRERERGEEGADATLWQNRGRLLLLVNSYDQVHAVAQEIARAPEWSGQVYGLKRGNDATGEEEDYWVEVSQWYETCYTSDFERFGGTEQGTILVAPMQAIGRGYNALNEQNIAAFGAIYFLTRPMPHPFDAQAQASEMNKTVLDWCNTPKHRLWRSKNVHSLATTLRREAYRLWYEMDHRYGYRPLSPDQKKDLAATTAGLIIQACGRLVRGGVPFDAFFVDAAWAPRRARKLKQKDTPYNSLLAAIIAVLLEYVNDPMGNVLLGSFAAALKRTRNFPHTLSFRRKT